MASANNVSVFNGTLLPQGQRRWRSFGAGLGLELVILTALVVLPMLMPQKLEAVRHYWATPIEVPVVKPWKPQPVEKPKVVKREVVKQLPKPAEIVPPKPKIYAPVFATPVAKTVAKHKNIQAPELAKALPPVSVGSSAIPTLEKPRAPVQTGGFGDPDAVPDNGRRDRNPNIAHVGMYDMPAGMGYGNGTGGTKGERGVVASTGFGNGVAIGGPNGASHGRVQQGLFGDEKAVVPTAKVKRTAASSNTKPVEILSVPRPAYTDAAKAHKIEGEVLLRVIFTATGQVKVQRVVQGLGYGLDEAAAAAARQIRFRPAQEDGQPVDFSAVARIVFQLAY
ncbi:MAG TPA: energy transducer TonB [Candidatus Polarisedimenticolia bacterium]|nr:energy transducer TonB [Candidatus Polarisedimenticolia bacterium]